MNKGGKIKNELAEEDIIHFYGEIKKIEDEDVNTPLYTGLYDALYNIEFNYGPFDQDKKLIDKLSYKEIMEGLNKPGGYEPNPHLDKLEAQEDYIKNKTPGAGWGEQGNPFNFTPNLFGDRYHGIPTSRRQEPAAGGSEPGLVEFPNFDRNPQVTNHPNQLELNDDDDTTHVEPIEEITGGYKKKSRKSRKSKKRSKKSRKNKKSRNKSKTKHKKRK